MGRLTEGFGFLHISVKKYNKMWLVHNVTSLTPSPKLYAIRKEVIKSKRDENDYQESHIDESNLK